MRGRPCNFIRGLYIQLSLKHGKHVDGIRFIVRETIVTSNTINNACALFFIDVPILGGAADCYPYGLAVGEIAWIYGRDINVKGEQSPQRRDAKFLESTSFLYC